MQTRGRTWFRERSRPAGCLLAYCLLWLVLTGGRPDSWLVGAPFVLAALGAGRLFPDRRDWRWRPFGLLAFLPFFALSSLRAGLDAAWRALHPSRPLQPGLLDYQWQVPPGPARVVLANVVTLLPGTLSVHLTGDRLVIHTLDSTRPVWAEVQRLEARVSGLFRSVSPFPPEDFHG